MYVSLRDITKEKYKEVCELEIPDEQQAHLSENVWSLVESHYNSTHQTRAIYLKNDIVGFIMWVYMSEVKTSIWRFMVAHEHQKKGIGRESLRQAVNEIGKKKGLKEIEICYSPKNTIARNLYLSLGFQETGMDKDKIEMYAVIKL